MDQRANRLKPFGTTIFAEMTALANHYDAVNLAQGFPDFDGPSPGKHAAIGAIRSNHNQYTPLPGLPDLRNAIAKWNHDLNNLDYDPDAEITVTNGCTEAITAALLGLVNPDDEVILFEPYYDSYRAACALAGATPRFVTIEPTDDGFAFSRDALERAFTPRTRAIIINTPHNPTGMVMTPEQLGWIADLCNEHDVIAIADEVYEQLTYDDTPHTSIATRPDMRDRTLVLSSMGKTFSFTGWKVGWAMGPAPLTGALRSAHQFITFCVPGPLQLGCAAMMNDSRPDVTALRTHLQSMRDKLGSALQDLGFVVRAPKGSYFIMADHTDVSQKRGISTDIEFCRWLPEHAAVAAVPPSVFYDTEGLGHNFVRFSFAKTEDTIDRAIHRLRLAFA
jgi:N-succinyldiaminopimelate aminotransferase